MMVSIQFFLRRMIAEFRSVRMGDEGVTAIEYGLIAALIAVVIISVISLVGSELNTTFSEIQQALANANSSS